MGFLIKIIVFAAIALVTYIFAISNMHDVTIYLDPFIEGGVKAPLFIIFISCLFIGIILTALLSKILGIGSKLKAKKLAKDLKESEKIISSLKSDLETKQDSIRLLANKD